MKVKVGFSKNSIKKTINTLKIAKTNFSSQILNDFYKECFNYFVSRANSYLELSNIGENVKNQIKSAWVYERTLTSAKFTNSAEKAVYVEFGVGLGGQTSPHYNALEAGYEYNVDSYSKNPDGTWFFRSSLSELDIPLENVEQLAGNENQMIFQTQGTPATMYAFNALEDLKFQMPKIWQNVKEKYWG